MVGSELLSRIIFLNKKLNLYKLSRQDCFRNIIVDDCHSSNAIEGNTLTKIETERLLEKGYPDKLHSDEESEIINYEDARKLIFSWYESSDNKLTMEKLVDLHATLITDPLISGYIRQRDGIDEVQINGRSDVKLTRAAQVYIELSDIIDIYNSNIQDIYKNENITEDMQMKLLEIIVEFKYDYVCVHPFLDGNGRTSRLLLNYLLMCNGFRPICISPEGEGKTYKDSIYKSQQTGDISYFKIYMYNEIVKNYENYVTSVKNKSEVRSWK